MAGDDEDQRRRIEDERMRRTDEILTKIQDRLDGHEERVATVLRANAGLRSALELFADLAQKRGDLTDGHRRILDKALEHAPQAVPAPTPKPRIHLELYVDKRRVPNNDIDCLARLPICLGRCCTLEFPLSSQDLDDGIKFEVENPYYIRHEADRYCSHYDRQHGGCGIYEKRPAPCRFYGCQDDKRIWLDFEKMIPAPLGAGIVPPTVTPR